MRHDHVRGGGRRALAAVCLMVLMAALAACGEDAPTQTTIGISSNTPIEGATRIVIFLKEEATETTERVIYEGETTFAFSGTLTGGGLKLGLRPGEAFDGEVVLYVTVRSDTAVLATGGGVYDVGRSSNVDLRVVPYDAACDVDRDGFLACTNPTGAENGCCNHLETATRSVLSDCGDDNDFLTSQWDAFDDANIWLRCADDRIPARDIHPFVATGVEATGCLCENGIDEDCFGGDFACGDTDNDNDGYAGLRDCNDDDPSIRPDAGEQLDEIDNDCDGEIDEAPCGIDFDDDGFCVLTDTGGDDCNDDDPGIFPGAFDVPLNGIDEDCDGEDARVFDPNDLDGDSRSGEQDCNDADSSIFDGAPEVCGDGIDQDCNGDDLACPDGDNDGDGFVGAASGGDDCDDDDFTIYPGAPELCGDSIDQSCDGSDVSCDNDGDGDGYLAPDDCNDDDASIAPYATEYCDGVDSDCDGFVDDGNPLQTEAGGEVVEVCTEIDETGECNRGSTVCSQQGESGVHVCAGRVEAQPEACDDPEATCTACDGLDNDCDGVVDNDVPNGDTCAIDGETGLCAVGVLVCPVGGDGTRVCTGPGPQTEVCDGDDNDCDGFTDESDEDENEPLALDCYSGPDGTEGEGACQGGQRVCENGVLPDVCVGEVRPVPESCTNPGEDDDCDGVDDNIDGIGDTCAADYLRDGDSAVDGEFGRCSVGVNQCVCPDLPRGTTVATAGDTTCDDSELLFRCIPNLAPRDETCANVGDDDDCDGTLDNIALLVDDDRAIYLPDDAPGGALTAVEFTVGNIDPTTNACELPLSTDTVDFGPDGGIVSGQSIFDGFAAGTGSPTSCQAGQFRCAGGDGTTPICFASGPSAVRRAQESCANTGFDSDCDGIDTLADIPGHGDACDSGAAGICGPGTYECSGALLACTPDIAVGATSEVCNGLDDNCDGFIDNVDGGVDVPALLDGGAVSFAGNTACDTGDPGVCEVGQWICNTNDIDLACSSLIDVGDLEEVCDRVDNNCDDAVDERVNVAAATLATLTHCGTCFNTCDAAAGDAVTCCPNGVDVADGAPNACTNTDLDRDNCGGCGLDIDGNELGQFICDQDEICDGGACACDGVPACEDDEFCSLDLGGCRCGTRGGDSVPACAEFEDCDLTDVENPVCVCDDDICEGDEVCSDTTSGLLCSCGDPNNPAAEGADAPCPVGSVCDASTCVCDPFSPDAGAAFCNARFGMTDGICLGDPDIGSAGCVDRADDTEFCGSGLVQCQDGEICDGGTCRCGTGGPTCLDSEVCVAGVCRCGGATGPDCPGNEICLNSGQCGCGDPTTGAEASCELTPLAINNGDTDARLCLPGGPNGFQCECGGDNEVCDTTGMAGLPQVCCPFDEDGVLGTTDDTCRTLLNDRFNCGDCGFDCTIQNADSFDETCEVGLCFDRVPPTVTSANITIDRTGCTGTAGANGNACIVGNTVVFRWNNAGPGGDNEGVDDVVAVDFDLSTFGLGVVTDETLQLAGGVYSYTWVIDESTPAIDSENLRFDVTATDDRDNVTADVQSTDAAEVDNRIPVVTQANVTIDDAGCVGSGGICSIGETVVFEWDNRAAPTGDGNDDIDAPARVSFNLANFNEGTPTADTGTGPVFSYTWVIDEGTVDGSGLTFTVTVTDDDGNVAAAVTSTNSASLDNDPPELTAGNVTIDVSGCSGGNAGICAVGETVVFEWDNSGAPSGDGNADVLELTRVDFDLSAFNLGTVNPDELTSGVFSYTWNVQEDGTGGVDGIDALDQTFDVTIRDDADNQTGPETSSESVDVDNISPVVNATELTFDTSQCDGDNNTCATGDVITFQWDGSVTASNGDIDQTTDVAFDLSAFDAALTAEEPDRITVGGVFEYDWTVPSGTLDDAALQFTVTALDDALNSTGPVVSDGSVSVDTQAPTVTAPRIEVVGSPYGIGDNMVVTWDNSGAGDGNLDLAATTPVRVNFFGITSPIDLTSVAARDDGLNGDTTAGDNVWTAVRSLQEFVDIDVTSERVQVAVTDDAGLATTTLDDDNAGFVVDANRPLVQPGDIAVLGDGGDGIFVAGDTVTVQWFPTNAVNDDVTDVSVSFFGLLSLDAAPTGTGGWEASYELLAGDLDNPSTAVSVTATDDGDNVDSDTDNDSYNVDAISPVVTNTEIAVTGDGDGIFTVGEQITVTWDGSAAVNNDVTNVTVNFFGITGQTNVAATPSGDDWVASYTLQTGDQDDPGIAVLVTATDEAANADTTADNDSYNVDAVDPVVDDADVTISGDGGDGLFASGDIVSVSWNSNDDVTNTDIDSVSVNFFGGLATVGASNSAGTWTATYTLQEDDLDDVDQIAVVTATDDGTNTDTGNSAQVDVDTVFPDVTTPNITIDATGCTGVGGVCVATDTVVFSWDNDATTGDGNADVTAVGQVTFDLTPFGLGEVNPQEPVVNDEYTYTWTVGGSLNITNQGFTVTVADDAGNTTADVPSADTIDVDSDGPTVSPEFLTITATCGGVAEPICVPGDSVTFTWDNRAGGDANPDVQDAAQVTFDLSDFGGSATQQPNEPSNRLFEYTLPLVATDDIDDAAASFRCTAVDNGGTSSGAVESDDFASVDLDAPTITDTNLTIDDSDCTGTCVAGNTVTFSWDNGADANPDLETGTATVLFDLSQAGGGSSVDPGAPDVSGVYSIDLPITAGTIDDATVGFTVTATDDAGLTSGAVASPVGQDISVDNQAPTVTDGNIDVSGDTAGEFNAGDVVLVTWDNRADPDGDDNLDIASVSADVFGITSVSAVDDGSDNGTCTDTTADDDIWTACYEVQSGDVATTSVVAVTATDDAGNATSTDDGTSFVIDATAALAYSGTTFTESAANDGSIANSLTLTLARDTFVVTSGTLTESTHYTVANVPTGLTASIAIDATGTVATFSLTGNATSNTDTDDVSDLTLTFLDAAFTNTDAADVTNSSRSDLSVDFIDITLSYDGTTFTESAANDGSIGNSLTVTLAGDTFTVTSGTLTESTHYTVANVPTGLTASVAIDATGTVATFSLTGTATSNTSADEVSNLTLTFLDAAFTNAQAANVTDSSRSDLVVDFFDATLTYSGDTFTEAGANDGSIGNSLTLTLAGDTFTVTSGTLTEATHFTVANVPTGLTADVSIDATGTVATFSLTGNATSNTDADDVSDLTLTFLDAAFTSSTSANVTSSSRDDLVVDFAD